MNWPNRLTILRIILSPVFFVFYFLPEWTGTDTAVSQSAVGSPIPVISAGAVVLIFVIIEVSDVLDGVIARKFGLVTDIGKVIDPFADVMSRMTYFFCFTLSGLMPAWIFLVLIYRELGATFLRLLMIRKGVAMAASIWGKAKAVTYALGGILGVLHFFFLQVLPDYRILVEGAAVAALVVFVLGALSSVLSFGTYVARALPDLGGDGL
jgi:CDP-diacylglycerol--glycerol-3-phosphate 3-phosphatidyltransferase